MMPLRVCQQVEALRINNSLTLRESSLGQLIQYAELIDIKWAIEQLRKIRMGVSFLRFIDSS